MSNTFHEEIKKEVERVGFNLIATRPTMFKPLKSVLAFSDTRKEYVVWTYNATYNGLFHGQYFTYRMNDTEEYKEHMRQRATQEWELRS